MSNEKNKQNKNEKKLVGEDRFTFIVEKPVPYLTEEQIEEIARCYGRMMAYEYIAENPDLFEKHREKLENESCTENSGDKAIFNGETCGTMYVKEDRGDGRCAA